MDIKLVIHFNFQSESEIPSIEKKDITMLIVQSPIIREASKRLIRAIIASLLPTLMTTPLRVVASLVV